jgi:hypothetical protein
MNRLLLCFALVFPSDFALAQDSSDLFNGWKNCLEKAAYLYAVSTKESADIVASGAFGACEKQEFLFHAAASETNKSPLDEVFKNSSEVRSQQRDWVISEVLKARSKQAD